MNWRIRYREPAARHEREAVVQANSPTEAMVKFCSTWGGRPEPARGSENVTSVTPESEMDW
jgi:hypothetical protein